MIGQTLDGKYRIERQLGRGGMGTVYLATHLHTERPVAVKVIAPQFMERPEFVERFRREARAAGRLRHPNVVDVTDFGFDETTEGRVAYLVMEYLDGCTLGEILEEERNLPVAWTVDILEQICSAVQEAHEQGIIHRDLKPDNIWLEPNQRGGYTVKVLDFGIAKLETQANGDTGEHDIDITSAPTISGGAIDTVADLPRDLTIHDNSAPTGAFGSGTIADAGLTIAFGEAATLIQTEPSLAAAVDQAADPDTVGTRLITEFPSTNSRRSVSKASESTLATKALTRVGAVLGTPVYMSPEQCRGEKLDARSDIYSLAVIAYQMLAGDPPFTGEFSKVMEAHRLQIPPPLSVKSVRRKLKREIMAALSKNPDDRPQSAEAFGTRLRSRTEGIFGLLRRGGMIYTEHIGKFLLLSAVFHIPMMLFTGILTGLSFLKVTEQISSTTANTGVGITATGLTITTSFFTYLIIGTITWVVVQSLAVPLRPIRLRAALRQARSKWKTFAGAGVLSTVLSIGIGIALFVIGLAISFIILWVFGVSFPISLGIGVGIGAFLGASAFLVASVMFVLAVPVVMMENSGAVQALKRSAMLVRRSLVTAVAAFLIMFLIPALSAGFLSALINISARAFDPDRNKSAVIVEQTVGGTDSTGGNSENNDTSRPSISYSIGGQRVNSADDPEKSMQSKIKDTLLETLLQILLLPMQIVVTSITAIIVALLYLKTRQAGGESLHDLLSAFEESDQPRKKWQERVRQRLIQSGRVSTGGRSQVQ